MAAGGFAHRPPAKSGGGRAEIRNFSKKLILCKQKPYTKYLLFCLHFVFAWFVPEYAWFVFVYYLLCVSICFLCVCIC